MHPLVRKDLLDHCKASSGNILYITLMNDIFDSYINSTIPCRLRVFKMWKSLFIVRAWKAWILRNKGLTLKNNFITSNTATCIEINSHSLIRIIDKLRETNNVELFHPWLMGSQACEAIFRSARSCSPNQMTSVNFNIAEFLMRHKRIQLCNDIPVELDGIFQFPRATNPSTHCSQVNDLPTVSEIDETIGEALAMALTELKATGINATEADCYTCLCNSIEKAPKSITNCSEAVSEFKDVELEELKEIQTNFQHYDFENDLSVNCSEEYKSGQYVKIYNFQSKNIEEIKKTTLCWYLNDDIRKPSSDRVRRFITMDNSKKTERIL